jgi:hypothetical protein
VLHARCACARSAGVQLRRFCSQASPGLGPLAVLSADFKQLTPQEQDKVTKEKVVRGGC